MLGLSPLRPARRITAMLPESRPTGVSATADLFSIMGGPATFPAPLVSLRLWMLRAALYPTDHSPLARLRLQSFLLCLDVLRDEHDACHLLPSALQRHRASYERGQGRLRYESRLGRPVLAHLQRGLRAGRGCQPQRPPQDNLPRWLGDCGAV
jgi:hypothetical protein